MFSCHLKCIPLLYLVHCYTHSIDDVHLTFRFVYVGIFKKFTVCLHRRGVHRQSLYNYQLNTPILKTNLHGKSDRYASFAFTKNYGNKYWYFLDMWWLKTLLVSCVKRLQYSFCFHFLYTSLDISFHKS